jgi:Methyltransferase domain
VLNLTHTIIRQQYNMESQQPPQYVAPGHFYSPIPGIEDIERAITAAPASYNGIDLREDRQLALLEKLSQYYAEIPFPAEKNEQFRFAFHNPSYSWGDAIILFCMIRELKPRRILEIGSGHTSALILDTNERYFRGAIDCTFLEPHPELLFSLLRPREDRETRVIPQKLQDVDLTLFDVLRAGDILFVDSSHVVKAGSDCQLLFSDILPRLNPGTFIHFHDVFDRFEYPAEWLREGRGWNEQYMLRAFLQFNNEFRIKLFTSYLVARHREWVERHMPNCLRNPGAQIWIERTAPQR